MTEFICCWTEFNSDHFRHEELLLSKDNRCFFRVWQNGEIESAVPIEIAAKDALDWCQKFNLPAPRFIWEAVELQERKLAELAKPKQQQENANSSKRIGTVGTDRFEVQDLDKNTWILFDESQFHCWGPIESSRGITPEGPPEWTDVSFVYRHNSGQWLIVEQSFHWEVGFASDRTLKRITPESAANMVALNGFPLPEDLACFRQKFEFDPAVPLGSKTSAEEAPFVPTALQKAILQALDGKALKKEALADIVSGGDGSRLYKPGGIRELRMQDQVRSQKRLGYYRPDRPPPELHLDIPQSDGDVPF